MRYLDPLMLSTIMSSTFSQDVGGGGGEANSSISPNNNNNMNKPTLLQMAIKNHIEDDNTNSDILSEPSMNRSFTTNINSATSPPIIISGGAGVASSGVTFTKHLPSRHSSSNSSSSVDSESFTSSGVGSSEPNELILDQLNQSTIAIEIPAQNLRIDLAPFKPASELRAEPGDIVEIDRILSSHWAIYVGDGDVVHVCGHGSQEVPDSEIATVQRAPLTSVAGENYCRVNNKVLRAKERNMLPFHNEIVKSKALSKVSINNNIIIIIVI